MVDRTQDAVKRLAIYHMARYAILPGGGYSDVIAYLIDRDRVRRSAVRAKAWAKQVVGAIRSSREGYLGTDEEIAQYILDRIEP